MHDDAERFYFTETDMKTVNLIAKKTYKTMKQLIKANNVARHIVGDDESEESLDLERESENEVEVAEEHKNYDPSNKNINTSYQTQNYSNTNKIASKKQSINDEQLSVSDLFAPDKKLKITEKKLFVKQMLMNSSMNTSFNPNKIMNSAVADLNFELVIEGE